LSRNADQIIGQLFSMSWASKKLLGEQAAAFEIELRRKLNELADGQNFIECVQFSAYMLSKQM
jgi:hypothetical protein